VPVGISCHDAADKQRQKLRALAKAMAVREKKLMQRKQQEQDEKEQENHDQQFPG
jgi:hypothetical protein